jgi:hypothetical protein
MRRRGALAVVLLALAAGCSSSSAADAPLAADAALSADARGAPDAHLASKFIDAPAGGVACTYAVNAACRTTGADYSCTETDFGNGWVRQDVVNLDCNNGVAGGPCGNDTEPYVVSVIRLCHAGGANQAAPCPDGSMPVTGPRGCAVCETTALTCK